MNISKENYELVMFDLLEGNLSEQQAIYVMGQIEGDDFLFNEWKLFKSTILVADKSVTYSNKKALLKKAPAMIPMWQTKWIAVAAAACLIIVLMVNRPTIDDAEGISSPVVTEMESAENGTSTIAQDLDNEQPTQINTIAPKLNNNNPLVSPPIVVEEISRNVNHTPLPQREVEQEPKEAIGLKTSEVADQEINPVLVSDLPKAVIADNSIQTEPQEVNIPTPEIQLSEESTPRKIHSLAEFVTLEPKDRIRDKIASMFSPLRHPQIRFKPHFDGSPSLDIELETTGYQAIASLQPFNKNK